MVGGFAIILVILAIASALTPVKSYKQQDVQPPAIVREVSNAPER